MSDGAMFKREWFKVSETAPEKLDEVVQVWKFGYGPGAESVVQVWGRQGATAFLLQQVIQRVSFGQAIDCATSLVRKWPQTRQIVTLGQGIGPGFADTLRAFCPVVTATPTGSQLARAAATARHLEAGQVVLCGAKSETSFADFVEEHVAFPMGPFSDQVNATSLALMALLRPNEIAQAPRTVPVHVTFSAEDMRAMVAEEFRKAMEEATPGLLAASAKVGAIIAAMEKYDAAKGPLELKKATDGVIAAAEALRTYPPLTYIDTPPGTDLPADCTACGSKAADHKSPCNCHCHKMIAGHRFVPDPDGTFPGQCDLKVTGHLGVLMCCGYPKEKHALDTMLFGEVRT